MSESGFKSVRYTNRWFCYLDLLGFSALVESQKIRRVIQTYGEVLEEMESIAGRNKRSGIYYSWFSDTFILYSRGGKKEDYVRLESASRIFFQKLILKRIPVRGAITFGKLYSHLERNIFVGPALIDAYKYGECQDWLGLLLTPTASSELAKLQIGPDGSPFYMPVPTSSVLRKISASGVYAYAFNNMGREGKNPLIERLELMQSSVDSEFRGKYERTIDFARRYQLT